MLKQPTQFEPAEQFDALLNEIGEKIAAVTGDLARLEWLRLKRSNFMQTTETTIDKTFDQTAEHIHAKWLRLKRSNFMQTTETTIDKTFDQTAEHIHATGRVCPTCKLPDCKEPEATNDGLYDDAGFITEPREPIVINACPKCNHLITPSGFHMNGIDCENVIECKTCDASRDRLSRNSFDSEALQHLYFCTNRPKPFARTDEQRFIDLRNDLNRMTTRAMRAEKRIVQFERLTASLSASIDRIIEIIEQEADDDAEAAA